MDLKAWRKSKGWGQEDLAAKIGSNQKTYSAYETGRIPTIPPDVQAKIRKLGYSGSWPSEEAAAGSTGAVTREEYEAIRQELWKSVGRLEKLETAFEKLGEIVRDLVRESEESRRPLRR